MRTSTQLLQELEEKNDIISNFQLGYIYSKGQIVERNDAKAFAYYNKAAEMDNSRQDPLLAKYKIKAAYNIGAMYFYGQGVAEDKEKGFLLIKNVAATGDLESNWLFGEMYALGAGVTQDFNKAKQHYLLATNKNHAKAQFSLGKMYFKGLLEGSAEKSCEVIANEYFKLAEQNGSIDTACFLQDWIDIWPQEDWDFLNVLKVKYVTKHTSKIGFAANIEPLNGSADKRAIREELLELIDETKRSFFSKENNEFSFKELINKYTIRFTKSLNKKNILWLRMLIEFGLGEGHYAIGHYYLQEMHKHSVKIKKIFNNLKDCKSKINSTELRNDIVIHYHYIAMYIITKFTLERALKEGILKAQQDLDELKEYHQYLDYERVWAYKDFLIFFSCEESLSTRHALNTYISLMKQDDIFFEQIQMIVAAINKFKSKNREEVQILVPTENLESLLLKFINNRELNEYKKWIGLLLDEQKVLEVNLLFLNHAIETKRTDTLQELLSWQSFDVNCIIPKLNITPLEFLIEQGNIDSIKKLLQRKDLDINLHYPLVKAVEENQLEIVEILLQHPNIDVNIVSEGNPTVLWLAAKYGYADIVTELLSHPKIYVDYQYGQLNEKEQANLAMGRKKMNAEEVALCYGHQEVGESIKEYKKSRISKKRQREDLQQAPTSTSLLFSAASLSSPEQRVDNDGDEDVIQINSQKGRLRHA